MGLYRHDANAIDAFCILFSGNVGYKKTAHQSGENSISWSINNPASRAVDGNTDPDMDNQHSCAHPMDSYGTNAWWMVDLGQKYSIHRVVIYNKKNPYSEYDISVESYDSLII